MNRKNNISTQTLYDYLSWLTICSVILLIFNIWLYQYNRVLHTFVFIYSPFGFVCCVLFIIYGIIRIFEKQKSGFLNIFINIITIIFSVVSILEKAPNYLSDKYMTVEESYISPDKKNIVVKYMNGSNSGYTHTSIIPFKNKEEYNLTDYRLPANCHYSKWIDANSVELISYPKKRKGPKTSCKKSINGIKIITRKSDKTLWEINHSM